MSTAAYITAICHSRISCDLVNASGVLTAGVRGSWTGGVWASMQHPSLAISSKQHSAESEPDHAVVVRVQSGSRESTPSECMSVPGPNFMQSVLVPQTECVDRGKHVPPAVDRTVHTHEVSHESATCQSIPQAVSVKPLFPVGSYVLAQKPQNQLE